MGNSMGCTIVPVPAPPPITAAPSPAAAIADRPIRRSHRILPEVNIAIPSRAMASTIDRTPDYTASLRIGFPPTRPSGQPTFLCAQGDPRPVPTRQSIIGTAQSLYEGSSRSASLMQAAQSLPPFRKLPASDELAVSVFAGFPARDRVIALAGRERRDLTLAGHFEKVMVDDAFGDAAAADQHAMIAQDHERAAVEVADQFRRHLVDRTRSPRTRDI